MSTPRGPVSAGGNRRRFPWKWLTLLLAAAIPAALAWAYLFLDEAPPDDLDLAIEFKSTPVEENGWRHLKEGDPEVNWPDYETDGAEDEGGEEIESPGARADKMLAGDVWDPVLAREILEKNEETLKRFDESLSYPGFQLWSEPSDLGLEGLTLLRRLCRVQAIKAITLEREQKPLEGFAEAMKILRMGRKLLRSAQSAVWSIIACSVESVGLSALESISRESIHSVCDHEPFLREIRSGDPLPVLLERSIRGEYAFATNVTREIQSGEEKWGTFAPFDGPPVPSLWRARMFFLPHQTIRLTAESARSFIQNISRPVIEWKRVEAPPCAWEGLGGTARLLPTRNGMGKYFAGLWIFAVRSSQLSLVRIKSRTDLLLLHLAIERFRKEEGRLPGTLDQLVPRRIESIPLDPYDGNPLRYSAEKRIVYSVGKDFMDSGGSVETDRRKSLEDETEPTVRLKE